MRTTTGKLNPVFALTDRRQVVITRIQAIWILENLPGEPAGVVPDAKEWERERQQVVQALREIIAAGENGRLKRTE